MVSSAARCLSACAAAWRRAGLSVTTPDFDAEVHRVPGRLQRAAQALAAGGLVQRLALDPQHPVVRVTRHQLGLQGQLAHQRRRRLRAPPARLHRGLPEVALFRGHQPAGWRRRLARATPPARAPAPRTTSLAGWPSQRSRRWPAACARCSTTGSTCPGGGAAGVRLRPRPGMRGALGRGRSGGAGCAPVSRTRAPGRRPGPPPASLRVFFSAGPAAAWERRRVERQQAQQHHGQRRVLVGRQPEFGSVRAGTCCRATGSRRRASAAASRAMSADSGSR